MADHNSTLFLHRNLYLEDMPSCILDCFSTCVLYTRRTQNNIGMVIRTLQSNSRGLVDKETTNTSPTSMQQLSRTHALFMYQVIRLFDGDVSMRAQGEKDLPLLQKWLDDLCNLRDNLGESVRSGDGYGLQTLPAWKVWALETHCLELEADAMAAMDI